MNNSSKLWRPEVLAPVGDQSALLAALSAGADAVYFGIDGQFNARAKSAGITLDALPDVVSRCHQAGTLALVTLNTLIFEPELGRVAVLIEAIASAGVDALIVQDPAVALLARQIAPALEVHASTQMTISSPEAARFAEALGVTRVVVPRELTLSQIERFKRETSLEIEVFVHGALCMSWSGQCLTSEAWGGRSANRGQCAQSCRMPYDLIVDGEHRPLGEVKYLLSPKDLSGVRAVEGLMRAGVECLKIEGRYKGPEYVSSAVKTYREWIEVIQRRDQDTPEARSHLSEQLTQLSLAYSRGLSDGFFGGSDHQSLVEGRFPKHRGVFLGYVSQVDGEWVEIRSQGDGRRFNPQAKGELSDPLPLYHYSEGVQSVARQEQGPILAPLQLEAGMGIVFDAGLPEGQERGGRVADVQAASHGWRFRVHALQPQEEMIGQRVWVTHSPQLQRGVTRAVKQEEAHPSAGRLRVSLQLQGEVDQPLTLTATLMSGPRRYLGVSVTVESSSLLVVQEGEGLSDTLLKSKLSTLGGTPFVCDQWGAPDLTGLGLPVSELKKLRRAAVSGILAKMEALRPHSIEAPALRALEHLIREKNTRFSSRGHDPQEAPQLVPMCRTTEQLEAVISCLSEDWGSSITEVELDWMEFVGLRQAVERARGAGLKVTIATVRVQKPGEAGYDHRIASLRPDGVLIRHWGALTHFSELPPDERPSLHGDFSLNITNSLAADRVMSYGLSTFTAAHDLDAAQLNALLDQCPSRKVAVTIHHHIPTFHTEHCVYAHLLSDGRDYRTCGRPCEQHRIELRDQKSMAHPVLVDVECRNTVFNASAQTAATLTEELIQRGVGRLRIEFVWENQEQSRRVLEGYLALYSGKINAQVLLKRLGIHERFGLTRGTMEVHR